MDLKNFILANIDQIDIYAHYFKVDSSEISNCINTNKKICNNDRVDTHPSLSFKYFGNKLIARDFGDLKYSGDIFEIVGVILNINYKTASGFVKICDDIILNVNQTQLNINEIKNEVTDIRIIERHFTPKNYRYFYNYGISKEYVDINYVCVNSFFINEFQAKYLYKDADPCFAYINNPNSYKLYFINRTKQSGRFLTNNKVPVECLNQLRLTKYKVLIKAYKDKILMERVCDILNIRDIQFLPLASETTRLRQDVVDLINDYTICKIYTMFDIDTCGIESSNWYKKTYNFDYILLGLEYNRKDPTDLFRLVKLKTFLNIFKKTYEKYFK